MFAFLESMEQRTRRDAKGCNDVMPDGSLPRSVSFPQDWDLRGELPAITTELSIKKRRLVVSSLLIGSSSAMSSMSGTSGLKFPMGHQNIIITDLGTEID